MKMVDSDAVFVAIDGYTLIFQDPIAQVHYDPQARLRLSPDADPIIYGSKTTFNNVNAVPAFSSRRVER